MAIVITRVDPTPVPGAKILAGSQMIINAVSTNMTSGYRLWPGAAVKMANTQMEPDQRFFQVELDQAVELLAVSFPASAAPYGTDETTWRMLVRNNLSWRVRPITACRTGFKIDPVSRACVQEWTPAQFEPEPELYLPLSPALPAPDEAEAALIPVTEQAQGKSGILLVAALGVVGLLLFR